MTVPSQFQESAAKVPSTNCGELGKTALKTDLHYQTGIPNHDMTNYKALGFDCQF